MVQKAHMGTNSEALGCDGLSGVEGVSYVSYPPPPPRHMQISSTQFHLILDTRSLGSFPRVPLLGRKKLSSTVTKKSELTAEGFLSQDLLDSLGIC